MRTTPADTELPERAPFGSQRLSLVDKFGVWLSQRAIARYVPHEARLEVLELGCGLQARNLVALQPRLRRGLGIDFQIDPSVKRIDRLEFIEGTVEAAAAVLGSESFDLILFISVLEHLDDPLPTLQGCHRWLKPGGTLLVNVPTWRGKTFLELSAFKLGLSPKCEMDEHKMYYDKRDLWPLLVRAGFLPSRITMRYHKFGLNVFAAARKP